MTHVILTGAGFCFGAAALNSSAFGGESVGAVIMFCLAGVVLMAMAQFDDDREK